MSELYEQLTTPFAENETFTLQKGGQSLTYVTGEAVTTRLNTVLGVDGWSFDIEEFGADEQHAWVLGRLQVYFPERAVVRAAFGECALQRGMVLGDARKGAATDSLKKAASLLGVGLYLSHREEQSRQTAQPKAPPPSQGDLRAYEEVWQDVPASSVLCSDCNGEIKASVRKDGSTWTAAEKATYSKNKYGRVLCYPCGQKQAG